MSKESTKQYWQSSRPPKDGASAPTSDEHDLSQWMEEPPGHVDRRSFLKAAGFTIAGAVAAAGCSRAPIRNAFPHIIQPEGVVAGRAVYYASVCGACESACGALIKSRDGRPIKLEGNPGHPLSKGGLCAKGQAALLGLYDSHRYAGPKVGDAGTSALLDATWEEIDQSLTASLEGLRSTGGSVRFVTGTVVSPTTRAAIARFLDTFSDAKHITYDALSSSAILDAHEKTHGLRVLPHYDFSKAQVIAGFDADFLGTWIDPVGYTAGYRAGRVLDGDSIYQSGGSGHFSRHVQFESRMTLTGSNADNRYRIAPEELGLVLSHLAARVARMAGTGVEAPEPPVWYSGFEEPPVSDVVLDELAEELWRAKGRSLVICGSQDVQHQILCNYLNHLLENYGETVDIERPSYQKQGNDAALAEFLEEIQSGQIDAVFVAGANPVYDLPGGAAMGEALDRVGLVVSFAERPDETSARARNVRSRKYVCPDHNFLESWGDAEAVHGRVSLMQPVIRPLNNSRALIESLNTWSGAPQSAYDALRQRWEREVYPASSGSASFVAFWDKSLHDGYATIESAPLSARSFNESAVSLITSADASDESAYTLVLYPKVSLGDGRHAYNPWLQELPDPISKVTWDNYANLSVAAADQLDVAEGDVIRIDAGGDGDAGTSGLVLELPVYIQPGQHDRVVSVALGYGGAVSRRFSDIGPAWIQARPSVGKDGLVGANAAPLLALEDGALRFERSGVKIAKTRRKHPLACTQTYHLITVPEHIAPAGGLRREIIQETTLAAYEEDPSSGRFHPLVLDEDLYPEDHLYKGHHWGMAVDLSACTGCSACVIACQAENNIPVVGKDEVRRRRDMHWMRIDRYYSGEGDDVDVFHQPMMCQQCDNAPCENVCPVLATVHTEEGLNAQAYNRCVGTRYCANNCAYKVRRSNWVNYNKKRD
ncbi:MAG: 4Fe-4S dicluster domain-containing protein, partial [Candidatus Hydrogenedentes bacterium]|nr:4Fe-4S dicluster domain-containing protein [Candidatus Hydrogenedentota bacterium]